MRWVDAGDLRVGDVLHLRSGGERVIEEIQVLAGGQRVYNFRVEELACYAVGRAGILVHKTRRRRRATQARRRKSVGRELALVLRTGEGSRRWTDAQIRELKATGKVRRYQGHHINSVKSCPLFAGLPENIPSF